MITVLRVFAAAFCVAGGVRLNFAAEPAHGDFPREQIQVGDAMREFRLVVPNTIDLKKPAPLVIAFHGMLIDSKDLMPVYTKLSEAAAKFKFVIAYPNAVGRSWGLAPDKIKNDLAMFDVLVKEISTRYKIDDRRIYVTGMSNGGYFAHLVAKERSTKIAAVASHSGPLGLQTLLGVHAERKFPVMIIHGDKDRVLSVDFARENRDKYKREGHEVEYLELAGQGHMWGSNVNPAIWKFFSEHPLKQ